MIEVALVVSRWLQFVAAAILCGAPAFCLYGLPAPSARDAHWVRRLIIGAAVLGAVAAVVMLLAQSGEMAGDAASAFDPSVVWAVLSDTYFGSVWIVRFVLILLTAALALMLPAGRAAWAALTAMGALVCSSLAWLGHGREGEGWIGAAHLPADILHLLAAGIWIGALVVLLRLLRRAAQGGGDEIAAAVQGLTRFSGVGAFVVAVILITGVVNAWALTAPHSITEALATDYARALLLKILLFAVMLALAALNRFALSPRLSAGATDPAASRAAIVALRRSIVVETGLAALVLGVVAALGVMEPPSAG